MTDVIRVLTCLFLVIFAAQAVAKPLLLNSQDTHSAACIDFDDTFERMVRICELGLTDPGASQSQRLEMMNSLGHALMELERYDRAEQVFRDMLKLGPDSAAARRGLGWIEEGRGNCEAALIHFEASRQIRPSAPALFGSAICQLDTGRLDLDAALLQMETGLSLDPGYAWGVREKGWRLLDARRYEEAAAEFSRAIALDGNDINARRGLASSLRRQDAFEPALKEINAAINIDPDGPYLLAERSLILFYLDRNKLAAKDAQRVIDLLPDWPTGYVRKARALSDLGRRGDALDLLGDAYERIGENSFLAYWYASLLYDDEQYGAAVSVLKRLAEAGIADKHDFGLLAEAQLARDYVDGARAAVGQALALDPGFSWSVFLDAVVLIEEGQFDSAVARFDEALDGGLAWRHFRMFNRHLVANGQFMRAIEIRVRYNDWKLSQPD